VDALERRLVPACDVDALVAKLVTHIKDLQREIQRLSLLRGTTRGNPKGERRLVSIEMATLEDDNMEE